jgi:hypothetical protein
MMSTANTLTQPTPPLTENELRGAIASLEFPATHTEPNDNSNLSSLWTLLNERVARAANAPTAITHTPQIQATASVASPAPTTATTPEGYGNAVAETYVVADTTLTTSPNVIEPEALASFAQNVPTTEAVVPAPAPQALTITNTETVAVRETATPKPSVSDVLTPTLVTFTPEVPPTVTPLKELLTATARRKTVPPVRLENALRNNTFVLSAHSQGELLPHITLELSAPLGKTVQTASRTGEDSTDSGLLATLESVETSGEGRTSLKAMVGYSTESPDIVIEVSCVDGSDWQFHTQENGSDVSVEWEVTRQKGKAIIIAAAIGRAKGAEDVILELSRTLITPATDEAVTPQWRNLVELKQPER